MKKKYYYVCEDSEPLDDNHCPMVYVRNAFGEGSSCSSTWNGFFNKDGTLREETGRRKEWFNKAFFEDRKIAEENCEYINKQAELNPNFWCGLRFKIMEIEI